jgi:hypothetical protein
VSGKAHKDVASLRKAARAEAKAAKKMAKEKRRSGADRLAEAARKREDAEAAPRKEPCE